MFAIVLRGNFSLTNFFIPNILTLLKSLRIVTVNDFQSMTESSESDIDISWEDGYCSTDDPEWKGMEGYLSTGE